MPLTNTPNDDVNRSEIMSCAEVVPSIAMDGCGPFPSSSPSHARIDGPRSVQRLSVRERNIPE